MAVKMFSSFRSKQKKNRGFSRSGITGSKSGGSFIPPVVKTIFEKGMSADFSSVRVHHDYNAVSLCDKIDARAFTTGRNIFFNKSQYSPFTKQGQYLLAHELAHVKLHANKADAIFRQPKTTPLTGLNTDTYVYKIGANLNTVILYLFSNSSLVKSYYPGGLAVADWPAAKFKIHQYDRDFETTYTRLHPGSHQNVKEIGGFYHRKTDTMHLKRLSRLGHTLHEAVHRLADSKSIGYPGTFVYEGLTQLIADIVLIQNKMERVTDHQYQANLSCANKLIETAGEERVLRYYFKFDKAFNEFINEKIQKKKLSPPTLQNLVKSMGC